MFDAVEGLVRSTDGRSVTLKHKKGKETVLERTMAYLVLEGRALAISDGFLFENVARSPEGQFLGSEYKAIEKVDRPVFTPTGSTLRSGITADVTTKPRLYWFARSSAKLRAGVSSSTEESAPTAVSRLRLSVPTWRKAPASFPCHSFFPINNSSAC
jgi:hypothetical protein